MVSQNENLITDWMQWTPSGSEWEASYEALFDIRSDLKLFRQYRDKFLRKTKEGKLYTDLLYKSSKKALSVLIDNPELMLQAMELIAAHKEAVSEVLSNEEGVIRNSGEILNFLNAFADKSPAALKLLANMIKEEIITKRKQGKLFLGFRIE